MTNSVIGLVIASLIIASASCARFDGPFFTPNAITYSSNDPYTVGSRAFIPILRYSADNNEDGNYRYAYETANGISVHQNGHLSGSGAVVADGGYTYTGPDGQTYTITYTADENGFQAVGAHIPTPPPLPALPEAIARAVSENVRLANDGDDGQYRPTVYRY